MNSNSQYAGIFFMLLAALGFSIMGGAAKALKENFNAGQLVFYRNAVGLIFLVPGLFIKPPVQQGGKPFRLAFRGLMGALALYTLLYCILHIPLGTAMSYNLTSTLFIAIFSFFLFKEYHGRKVLLAVVAGFMGMLLIYKPVMHLPWYYHLAGLVSGITSAIAYLTVNRLAKYYDPRIIVLSFLLSGFLIPLITMIVHYTTGMQTDGLFIVDFRLPTDLEWLWVLLMGLAALFGQYFVTRAYGSDKAGIVSVFGYANIIYSVFIGMLLCDPFPDWMSWAGIFCIIGSGVIITLVKKKSADRRA
ncbi:MAG: EamA family transporter [Sphingobacteriales bacterium]|nr:EamA family transporter [Sphingobacteriales bacterium]